MKRIWCLFFLLILGSVCFAQSKFDVLRFWDFLEQFDYPSDFNMFRPAQMALENEPEIRNVSIFANAPLWVKDLRRGEIVFFGTLPFTVFFTRTIMGAIRMGQHDWDRRYAPWPFQSVGAVGLSSNELFWMFSIAGTVSLAISIADHIIVRHKRKVLPLSCE
jgi:hypothetical protein